MEKSWFEKLVKREELKNGSWEYTCPLNLWSVIAPTKNQATAEATMYFLQYQMGGEYAGLMS